MDDLKKQLFSTPLLRVLDLLLQHPGVELSDQQVAGAIEGVGRSAVHLALVRLARLGVTTRTHRDRRCYDALNPGHPWLHHLKIAGNLMALEPLVALLKPHASKVVLFGSRADATSRVDSDYDVAVVTNEPGTVRRIANESEFGGTLQLVIKTPAEMLDLDSREPVFASNIRKGVIVWER